MINVAKS